MSKGYKGGDFEREICKKLSLWWTKGERDDVFWRSSQSGGRATQRSKSGKRTYGSYGDIAAVDPIGEPLLKLFTIELKRGSSYSCPGDLLDFKPKNGSHPWVKCLRQALRCYKEAGSKSWMMICRRDHRLPIVFISTKIHKSLGDGSPFLRPPALRFDLMVCDEDGWPVRVRFVGQPLDNFLKRVTPSQIIRYCENT